MTKAAEQVVTQLKRYWALATVVAIIASGYGAMVYQVADLRETVGKFVDQGPRYSLKDHNIFADRQHAIDQDQTQRIIILEQYHKGN